MKLMSMTSFIEEQEKLIPATEHGPVKDWDRIYVQRTISYCRFFRHPLTLGMFVPVDEEGNVLKNPHARDEDAGAEKEELQIEFNNALEKVLFEGFKIEDIGLGSFAIKKRGWIIMRCSKAIGAKWENVASYQTIEDLVNLDIELTSSALKQIGL